MNNIKKFQEFVNESKVNMTNKLSSLLQEFERSLKSKIKYESRTSCDIWREIIAEFKLQNINLPKDWNKIYNIIKPYVHMSKSYFETYLINVICYKEEDEEF